MITALKKIIALLFISSLVFAWDAPYRVDDKKTLMNFRDLETAVVDTYSTQIFMGYKGPRQVTSLPTSGVREGVWVYNLTDHSMYYSSETVKGVYSWKQY